MTWLDARDASEGRLPPGWVYCDRPRRGAGEKHDRIWGAPAPDVGGEDRRMTFRSLATALAWANSAAPSPPSLSHQMDTTEAAAARTAAMSTLHATTVDAAAKASGHEKPTAVVSKADKRVAKRETREKLLAAMFKGLPKQSGRALKPIMQLDMATGRVIRVWPSGTAAAQKLGVSPSSISMAANHRQLCAGHRCDHAHGYLWRFLKNATRAERGEYAGYYDSSDDDDADEQAGSGGEAAYENGDRDAQAGMSEEEEQHKSQAGSSQFVHSYVSRPVEQIDPTTLEVIRQWPSVSAAGSALSLFSSNISEAARGKRVTAGKYRWRFVSNRTNSSTREPGVDPINGYVARRVADCAVHMEEPDRAAKKLRLSLRPRPRVGDRVEARFDGGALWYAGRIDAVNDDGTLAVRYDDGDYEADVAAVDVRETADNGDGDAVAPRSPSPRKGTDKRQPKRACAASAVEDDGQAIRRGRLPHETEVRPIDGTTVWKRHPSISAAARAIGITMQALGHYLNRTNGSTLEPGVDPINGYVARRVADNAPADSEVDTGQSEEEEKEEEEEEEERSLETGDAGVVRWERAKVHVLSLSLPKEPVHVLS